MQLKSSLMAILAILLYAGEPCKGQTVESTGTLCWNSVSQIERALASVVAIKALDDEGSAFTSGTGFVVREDGWIVTNFHVIANAGALEVTTLDGRQSWRVSGVGPYNKKSDWALLKVPAGKLPTLRIGSTTPLRVGAGVIAIGNPFGLNGSVTSGIAS